MKNLNYFFRSYKDEIIAYTINIVALGLAYFLQSNTTIFILSLIVFVLSLFTVIYIRTKDKEFYFIPFNKPRDKNNWIGKGYFEYLNSENSFLIKNASPGYIYSNCLDWSNYKVSFDFKIINQCLGVIIKAVNLSNYVMFQILNDGIRPHLRVNGGWQVWEHPQAGLTFSKKLSKDFWHKCKLTCEQDFIKIVILENEKIIFNRQWNIPTGHLIFEFKKDEKDKSVNIPFPINLEYGSAGFRNFGDERALICNFLIEKL